MWFLYCKFSKGCAVERIFNIQWRSKVLRGPGSTVWSIVCCAKAQSQAQRPKSGDAHWSVSSPSQVWGEAPAAKSFDVFFSLQRLSKITFTPFIVSFSENRACYFQLPYSCVARSGPSGAREPRFIECHCIGQYLLILWSTFLSHSQWPPRTPFGHIWALIWSGVRGNIARTALQ